MSSTDQPEPKSESASGNDQRGGGGIFSWVTSVRARLGLQGPPTLRDTLEYALREDQADAAGAFSLEERGMLLRLLRESRRGYHGAARRHYRHRRKRAFK